MRNLVPPTTHYFQEQNLDTWSLAKPYSIPPPRTDVNQPYKDWRWGQKYHQILFVGGSGGEAPREKIGILTIQKHDFLDKNTYSNLPKDWRQPKTFFTKITLIVETKRFIVIVQKN